MLIRVDSIDHLLVDVSEYLGCTADEFLCDIKYIDLRYRENGVKYIRSKFTQELPEIYLCHLTRRLNGDTSDKVLPLNRVLTSDTTLATFFKQYGVTFEQRDNGTISVLYNNEPLEWWKYGEDRHSVKRVHIRTTSDYCVNGFQFLYDIQNNAKDFNYYTKVPEFVRDLGPTFNPQIVDAFEKESSPYVALCNLPCAQVEFDERGCSFQEQYIYNVMSFIKEYYYEHYLLKNNAILLAKSDTCLDVKRWIPVSELE